MDCSHRPVKALYEGWPKSNESSKYHKTNGGKRLEEFEGEDEFLNKLWEIRMAPEQSEKLSLYPIDQDVLQFMNEAYAIL